MDVRRTCFACLLLSGAAMVGCAGGEAQREGTPTQTQVISDPGSWAKAHFEKRIGSAGTLSSYAHDLDRDGTDDLLIATTAGAGNGGSPHLAFKGVEAGYVLLGDLFMHPRAFRVLAPSEECNARLVIYQRLGGSEGDIVWLVSRNGQFIEERRERIHPGDGGTDEGRQRYEEVFGS